MVPKSWMPKRQIHWPSVCSMARRNQLTCPSVPSVGERPESRRSHSPSPGRPNPAPASSHLRRGGAAKRPRQTCPVLAGPDGTTPSDTSITPRQAPMYPGGKARKCGAADLGRRGGRRACRVSGGARSALPVSKVPGAARRALARSLGYGGVPPGGVQGTPRRDSPPPRHQSSRGHTKIGLLLLELVHPLGRDEARLSGNRGIASSVGGPPGLRPPGVHPCAGWPRRAAPRPGPSRSRPRPRRPDTSLARSRARRRASKSR
jgi:hypothetical protein